MAEPSLNRKSIARVAKKLCELGAMTEDLAEVFGVPIEEIERWLSSYGEFSIACANGRVAAVNKISNLLLKRATGMNVPHRKIFTIDGMAAQITVEESRPPDLEAANAVLGDFRQRPEIKQHSNALLTAREEEAMALLQGGCGLRNGKRV